MSLSGRCFTFGSRAHAARVGAAAPIRSLALTTSAILMYLNDIHCHLLSVVDNSLVLFIVVLVFFVSTRTVLLFVIEIFGGHGGSRQILSRESSSTRYLSPVS